MSAASASTGRGGTLNSGLFYVFLVVFVLVSVFPLVWILR